MIVARRDLEKVVAPKEAQTILQMAHRYSGDCDYITKMSKNREGNICDLAFFDIDKLMALQTKRMTEAQPHCLKRMTSFYEKLESTIEKLADLQ